MSGGGGGGGSTNTIQKADPWGPIQPYLLDAASNIQSIYGMGAPAYFPGQTYVSPNIYQLGSIQGLTDYAGSPELASMLGGGFTTQMSLMNPYSNPYASMGMGLIQPSAYTAMTGMGYLDPSYQYSSPAMEMVLPSAYTGAAIQGAGLNYDPGLYTPMANISGFADPNQALAGMMSTGGVNPYLDAMVGAAQQNALQNYQMTAGQAADAFQTQIAPQIQDARTLISDALGQFTEQALPQITDQALRTGNLNSTRTDLAEGTALAGIYDTLNRDLTNLARTADITGANVYQDLLRNQAFALDDVNALASSMYGGAWDQAQQNILGAANTAAGLQTNWNNAMMNMAQMDLDRQIANQNLIRDMMGLSLESSLGWGGLGADTAGTWGGLAADMAGLGADTFGNVYDTATSNMVRSLGLLPSTMNLGAYPSTLYAQAGDALYGFDQQALQDAMDRWNYEQQADMGWASDYANLLSMLGGMGGSTVSTAELPGQNNLLTAAGLGLMGGTLGASLFPGAATIGSGALAMNPYTALLGLGLGFL